MWSKLRAKMYTKFGLRQHGDIDDAKQNTTLQPSIRKCLADVWLISRLLLSSRRGPAPKFFEGGRGTASGRVETNCEGVRTAMPDKATERTTEL